MSSRIASEFVGDQPPRSLTLALQHVAKEPLSSPLVSSLRHQNVENIAVLIHSSPQVELLSLDLHEQLIDVPDVAQPALLLSDRAGVSWPELQTPETDCLVGDDDPSFGQQILNVTKAESEPMVKRDGVADDFRGGNGGVGRVVSSSNCRRPPVNLTAPSSLSANEGKSIGDRFSRRWDPGWKTVVVRKNSIRLDFTLSY